MLVVEDLQVSYGTTEAVRGVSLSIDAGAAVALLGANGAGKTSTLRGITRLEPIKGKVSFDGKDLAGLAPEAVARLGLIHVPEGRHVFGDLTVHENLQMGETAKSGRSGWSFDDVYDLFPALVPLRARLGFALSGGEQQMVVLGRALMAAPRCLLVDEPSLGLAPVIAHAVAEALVEVRDRMSLLVVEQNVHLATQVCDRAVVIAEGQIRFEAESHELRDSDELLASYLGQRRTGAGT